MPAQGAVVALQSCVVRDVLRLDVRHRRRPAPRRKHMRERQRGFRPERNGEQGRH